MQRRILVACACAALLILAIVPLARAGQTWSRYPDNPVLRTSSSGWDGAHLMGPAVLKDESEYKMYYSAWGVTATSIGLATSPDGIVWSRHASNPLLAPSAGAWDSVAVMSPTVLREDGVYKMWYGGDNGVQSAIGYATSDDGVVWAKHGEPVLVSTPGTWDQGAMTAPCVITDSAGYKMYYMGNDGSVWRIGMAVSDDGIVWTKHPGALLAPRPEAWDHNEVGHPAVVLLDDGYHMWYTDYTDIGYATSPDGIVWTRQGAGPVLQPLAPNEPCQVIAPSVVVEGESILMWYVSGCVEMTINLATTETPRTPTPSPTRTMTPTVTPTFDPATRPFRVYFPVIVKDVPPPTATPTPTRTATRTATATPVPAGMYPLFTDGFEGAWPGAWVAYDGDGSANGEYTWAKRPCQPFQGQNSAWAIGAGANGAGLGCGAVYPNNADSWMIAGPFNLQGMQAAELRFQLWLNSQPQVDGVCRTVSVDGAHFYGTCTAGNSYGWVERVTDLRNVLSLGNVVGSPQVWIGLAFLSDGATTYPHGAYVDNVIVNQCQRNCPSVSSAAAAEPLPGLIEYPIELVLP